MRPRTRLLERVLSGRSGANIRYADLLALLRRLGFDERIRGSHHIFTRDDLDEIVNLQPRAVRLNRIRYVRSGTSFCVTNWRKCTDVEV